MKPICDISKCDGNMYYIIRRARMALTDARREKDADRMSERAWKAGSEEKMMEVLREFVEIRGAA